MNGTKKAVTAMIELTGRVTASAIWSIDGKKISLPYRCDVPESQTISKILEYEQILQNKAYEDDNTCLCGMFRFFGGIAFVKIGMVFEKTFFECYSYFAAQFAAQWADGTRCLHSKNIGYFYVFDCMLKCCNDPIQYDFRYILDEIPDSSAFCALTERAFAEYWTPKIEVMMAQVESLAVVCKRVGDVRVSKYMMQIPENTEAYLRKLAHEYTSRRELISLRKLYNFIFGNDSRSTFPGGDSDLFGLIKSVENEETNAQNRKFVAENRISMDMYLNEWILYAIHGVTLHYMKLDFTEIQRASMRTEVKSFLKNRFSGAIRTNYRIFPTIVYAANMLCKNNARLRYFSDIDETDLKMLQLSMETDNGKSQSYIMNVFYDCRVMFDYLCGDERDVDLKTPKPYSNPFKGVTFVNASKYSKNTPYMPNDIAVGLSAYANELSETDALVLRIFNETGMRAKEVAFLEEDCIEKTRTGKHMMLKFVPYKVLKARRKAGLGDYHRVQVSLELAKLIAEQAKRTEPLRLKYCLQYIFLHQNKGYKVSMLNVSYFIIKINKLIKRHKLCDESGQLWNFTSRQCRKTLVVNMIENGAVIEEIIYQLGHLDHSTAAKYYAEVKAIKLAELNSEFFEKQFDLLLSKEQLVKYSEEERRLLYMDFRLGYRRVEMGFCTKKLCNGACGSKNRMYHCANCKNLCTGKKYLTYWKKLLQAQENTVAKLINVYDTEGITDFSDFAEYRLERNLLEVYRAVTDKIMESEVLDRE
jgi:integrase